MWFTSTTILQTYQEKKKHHYEEHRTHYAAQHKRYEPEEPKLEAEQPKPNAEQPIKQHQHEFVTILLSRTNLQLETIANIANVTLSFVEDLRKTLTQK